MLPSARIPFFPYAFGILTVCFLVAASGSNSNLGKKAPTAFEWNKINQNCWYPKNKIGKSKKFFTLFPTSSYENRATRDDNIFRINRASPSNCRRAIILPLIAQRGKVLGLAGPGQKRLGINNLVVGFYLAVYTAYVTPNGDSLSTMNYEL